MGGRERKGLGLRAVCPECDPHSAGRSRGQVGTAGAVGASVQTEARKAAQRLVGAEDCEGRSPALETGQVHFL